MDHRRPNTNHPWPNGQGERRHRTRNEATVNTYDEEPHDHLNAHLHTFLMAENFAKRLNTRTGLTPDEPIGQCWQEEPERLTINPYHHTLGLNS
jgi:hypothetical protein